MTNPLNTTVKCPTGLQIGRVTVTSLDIHQGPDGVTSICMTDGEVTMRIFADADQTAHLAESAEQEEERIRAFGRLAR